MEKELKLGSSLNDLIIRINDSEAEYILKLAEEVNRGMNELSEAVQAATSDTDAAKCRAFFGPIMGFVIADIMMPIEESFR
jgi:hypothetical protein